MKLLKDLGMEYPTENSKTRRRFGIYECPNCNKEFRADTYNVRTNTSTQCSTCGIKSTNKKNTKHGDSTKKTLLYSRWQGMKNRCYISSNKDFKHYGDNGVTVCDEWLNNYEACKKWALSNGFKNNLEIDKDIIKIDNKVY